MMASEADWKTLQKTENFSPVTEMIQTDSTNIPAKKIYSFVNGTTVTETFEGEKTKTNIRLSSSGIFTIGILILLQLIFVTMAYGPIAAFLVELFPANIR